MGKVNWNDTPTNNSSSGNGKLPFLKFEAGKDYIIRPIRDPHEIIQYFNRVNGQARNAVTDVEGSKCVIQSYKDENGKPRFKQVKRYLVNCILRDDGELYIANLPSTVFFQMSEWARENECNPGHPKEGADFKIKVEKTGDKAINVKYHCIPLKSRPLSEAEVKHIKEIGGLFNFEEIPIFQPVPQDKIEVALGLKEEDEGNDSGNASASAPFDEDVSFDDNTDKAAVVDDDDIDF